MKEYQIGEIIEGTIINIRDFGAIMIFNDNKKVKLSLQLRIMKMAFQKQDWK